MHAVFNFINFIQYNQPRIWQSYRLRIFLIYCTDIVRLRLVQFQIVLFCTIVAQYFCHCQVKDNKKIQLRINGAEFIIFKFYILLMSIMTIITVTIIANNFTIICSPCSVPYRGYSFLHYLWWFTFSAAAFIAFKLCSRFYSIVPIFFIWIMFKYYIFQKSPTSLTKASW